MPPLTIVHSEASNGWGGQEIRIFNEMQAMRQRGYRMILATPQGTRIGQECAKADFEVWHFNDAKWAYPYSILNMAKALDTNRVHIVNTHSSRDGWILGIASRLAGVPLLLRSKHIDVSYPNPKISRFAYHHLPHDVLTTSQAISNNLIDNLKLDASRVHCVPTGIDTQRFQPKPSTALHQELQLPAHTTIIGMVAVLRSWKGHLLFLDSICQLPADLPPTHFVIVGEGPMRFLIEQRIQELKLQNRVTLLGHRDDIPSVLCALDAVVLPSTAHEGIPQILLQAMACAKPIIGSNVGGIPEVIEHEHNGLLVEKSNPTALAQALTKLITTPKLRQTYGECGLKKVRETHSLQYMIQRLESIYQSAGLLSA